VSRKFLRQCLLVAGIVCGLGALPTALIFTYVGFYYWMPSYSAVAYFDRYGFNVRLDFYQTDDEMRDSGRYLSVIAGSAYHTVMLPGWGWARRARTSVYRIDEGHIAVLSPLGYDYRVTLYPFAFVPVVSDDGAQWQYLGAFDFLFPPDGRPRLQFFDAHLPECIPMSGDPGSWAALPRAQARQANCPTPESE
jgi:hypothetical protein